MKSINQRLHTLAFFLIAPVLFIMLRKRGKIYLPIVLAGVLVAGCFRHFYEIDSQVPISAEMISKMESSEKIYIGHFGDSIVALQHVRAVGSDIEAEIQPLQEGMLSKAYSRKNTSRYYKPKTEANILLLVDLYIDKDQLPAVTANSQKVVIPLTSIRKMDVYAKDKGRTNTNIVFSSIGLGVAVLLVVASAGFLISCNCPQVSMQDGNQFGFKSGLYSGAVNSNLERSDYLLLDNFAPAKDSVQIRIDNVSGEQQYINRLQLLQVSHPAGTKVLVDRHGRIYSYAAPVSPLAVIDNSGKDYSRQVKYPDSENAGFTQPGKDGEASSLVLQFPANMAGKKARLILKAKNTPWSGYMYKEFQGLYGNAYTSIRDAQEKMDPSVSQNWIINQSLPLKVYVENMSGEWQMADYFQMPGNTAKRDMILELDIPGTAFQTVRIKLETVFRFWEIDYAALDDSEQAGLDGIWVSPSKALVSTGENALAKISATDKDYLSLTGDAFLDLQYTNLPGKNDTETYFLCGTGYYHQSPVNTGSPDLAALNKFKNPGYFQLFSLQEYEKVSTELAKGMYAGKNNRARK